MSEEPHKWFCRDTRIYTGDGGFDIRNLPNPLRRAKLIVDAVNDFRPAADTPEREALLALAAHVQAGSHMGWDQRTKIADALRRLAPSTPDARLASNVREATIEECAKLAEQGLTRFSPLEIARAIRALSTTGEPKL